MRSLRFSKLKLRIVNCLFAIKKKTVRDLESIGDKRSTRSYKKEEGKMCMQKKKKNKKEEKIKKKKVVETELYYLGGKTIYSSL